VTVSGRRLAGASATAGASTGVSVQRWTCSAGLRALRTRALLTDGNDDVLLLVQQTGRRIVSQLGRETTALPGTGILVSNADFDSHVLPEPCRFICVALPHKTMKALAPALADGFARPTAPETGALRLLLSYLDILETTETPQAPELEHAVATHIHDLCALAIGATRDAAEIARGRGVRAARLHRIKADVIQNLHDGDVSAPALAQRHRVTARYIHKLFEGEGTTLSKFVLGQRLAQVHRMLADPSHAHQHIATLAYDVGFGDLSTFNRQFRHHFGVTPSDVRAETAA
jgi:AraC-like DNA-binding protein